MDEDDKLSYLTYFAPTKTRKVTRGNALLNFVRKSKHIYSFCTFKPFYKLKCFHRFTNDHFYHSGFVKLKCSKQYKIGLIKKCIGLSKTNVFTGLFVNN